MKIFPSSSIKKLDAYTIENEPIASIDLMERAATVLTKAITDRWNTETPVTIFAGPGNNGGDALAVARMMAEKGYKIDGIKQAESLGALVFHAGTKRSDNDILTNGGRVLGVTALGDNLEDAIQKAYKYVDLVNFKNAHFRKDIGIKKEI